MEGGRSKLSNVSEERPWKAYRTCLCPDSKHISPPKDFWLKEENYIPDGSGNPIKPPWITTCPLACFEVIRSRLPDDDLRVYPEFCKATNTYGARNMKWTKIIDLAREWITIQGGNPDNLQFDRNAGRKSLGKLCAEYGIPYEESVEIHGDLYVTWIQFYQTNLKKRKVDLPRTQSRNPEVATACHRKIARAWGRGRAVREDPDQFSMNQLGRLMAASLRAMGRGDEVARILD